jgi:hypothetical protein
MFHARAVAVGKPVISAGAGFPRFRGRDKKSLRLNRRAF